MRILIVGSDVNACSIAELMCQTSGVDIVFITAGSDMNCNFAQKVDIPENDNAELLDFAIANEISLTIVTSTLAIQNNIAECFADSRQQIFAPSAQAASIALYKSFAKKLMYRLKIPTMKFGIFERENQAIEYASEARKPLVIKNDTHIAGEHSIFASTFKKAKSAIEHCFSYPENKIIIEDCIEASDAVIYFITDGYTALPIGSVCTDNKFSYSSSVYSPDKYISDELEIKILREVIYPVIDELAARAVPYCGILGVELLVHNETYNVVEFLPFFKKIHLQSILPVIKTDLADLFISAACGSLSDEYSCIEFYNLSTFSKVVPKFNIEQFKILDDTNLKYVISGKNIILTQCARTAGRAREILLDNINFLQNSEAENESF